MLGVAARAGTLPAVLAMLEGLRAEALLTAVPLPQRAGEKPPALRPPARLLSAAETAVSLGKSRSWVYRHRHSLPLVQLPSGRYAFDSTRLDSWIRKRTHGLP
jgi:predicted DNA-binding transcriptional regulator AlpA